MLSNFHDLMKQINVDDLCQLPPNLLQMLPLHIHCKDEAGRYINICDRVASDVGLSTSELIGRSDHDIDCLGEHEAASFRAIDKYIMHKETSQFFIQTVTLANGKKHLAMNHKYPLRSKRNKVIGVISMGMVTTFEQGPYTDPRCPILNQIFASNPAITETLTQRQTSCLYYLVKGHSTKEIAKQLQLSPRTVEHYIDAIKKKWNCVTRADLVDYVMMT